MSKIHSGCCCAEGMRECGAVRVSVMSGDKGIAAYDGLCEGCLSALEAHDLDIGHLSSGMPIAEVERLRQERDDARTEVARLEGLVRALTACDEADSAEDEVGRLRAAVREAHRALTYSRHSDRRAQERAAALLAPFVEVT